MTQLTRIRKSEFCSRRFCFKNQNWNLKMKKSLSFRKVLFPVVAVFLSLSGTLSTATVRPNIVLIVADDLVRVFFRCCGCCQCCCGWKRCCCCCSCSCVSDESHVVGQLWVLDAIHSLFVRNFHKMKWSNTWLFTVWAVLILFTYQRHRILHVHNSYGYGFRREVNPQNSVLAECKLAGRGTEGPRFEPYH